MAELAFGDLGDLQIHHSCGVRSCVNPRHLSPISAAENVGEMFQRKSYVSRIKQLEAALGALAPDHPLLIFPSVCDSAATPPTGDDTTPIEED